MLGNQPVTFLAEQHFIIVAILVDSTGVDHSHIATVVAIVEIEQHLVVGAAIGFGIAVGHCIGERGRSSR
jgi:hypothetical protein